MPAVNNKNCTNNIIGESQLDSFSNAPLISSSDSVVAALKMSLVASSPQNKQQQLSNIADSRDIGCMLSSSSLLADTSPLDILLYASQLASSPSVALSSPLTPVEENRQFSHCFTTSTVTGQLPASVPPAIIRKRGRPRRAPDAAVKPAPKKVRVAAENLLSIHQSSEVSESGGSNCMSKQEFTSLQLGENILEKRENGIVFENKNGNINSSEIDVLTAFLNQEPPQHLQLQQQESTPFDSAVDFDDTNFASQVSGVFSYEHPPRYYRENLHGDETDEENDNIFYQPNHHHHHHQHSHNDHRMITTNVHHTSVIPLRRQDSSLSATSAASDTTGIAASLSAATLKAVATAKRFECKECKRTFSRLFNLKSHLHTHNPTRAKNYTCEICNVGFCRQQDLARHATVHDKSRIMKCPTCPGKTFSRKDALRRHIRLNGCCDVSVLDAM
ncbi:hypothetical protein HK100_012855 [Physocladia obscura]|uniref:C2H2-type domain-containing protein n=1 Tax=Physocladia obscura TaxID=109957 RepID=A0AAD5XFY5_9FUNG|nr:hypothetical protein HK100_012855 [Physocladia obscura]